MKARYERTFEYGKSIARYLLMAAVIFGLAAFLLVPDNRLAQLILILASFGAMVAMVVVMYRYCRCPYCGKRIIAGALAVSSCPTCRRSLSTGKKVKKKSR